MRLKYPTKLIIAPSSFYDDGKQQIWIVLEQDKNNNNKGFKNPCSKHGYINKYLNIQIKNAKLDKKSVKKGSECIPCARNSWGKQKRFYKSYQVKNEAEVIIAFFNYKLIYGNELSNSKM